MAGSHHAHPARPSRWCAAVPMAGKSWLPSIFFPTLRRAARNHRYHGRMRPLGSRLVSFFCSIQDLRGDLESRYEFQSKVVGMRVRSTDDKARPCAAVCTTLCVCVCVCVTRENLVRIKIPGYWRRSPVCENGVLFPGIPSSHHRRNRR